MAWPRYIPFSTKEALAAFRESTKTDPEFMMGYWGEAMAHNHRSGENRTPLPRAPWWLNSKETPKTLCP